MFPEAIPYLVCPRHPSQGLSLADAFLADDGEIAAGGLTCAACANVYPIKQGIADLLGPAGRPANLTQVTNYLPPVAWGYERFWRQHALTMLTGEPFGYERELPLITGMLAVERGGVFVDLACSNGLYARAIEGARGAAPGHVLGIDHALPMLLQARAFARQQGLRISYLRASAQALPLRDGAVAGCAMGGSLNEIGDAPAALSELRRILAPNGRAALMCLVTSSNSAAHTLQRLLGLAGIAFWSRDQLNRLLAAAGLQVVEQEQYRVVVFSRLERAAWIARRPDAH